MAAKKIQPPKPITWLVMGFSLAMVVMVWLHLLNRLKARGAAGMLGASGDPEASDFFYRPPTEPDAWESPLRLRRLPTKRVMPIEFSSAGSEQVNLFNENGTLKSVRIADTSATLVGGEAGDDGVPPLLRRPARPEDEENELEPPVDSQEP